MHTNWSNSEPGYYSCQYSVQVEYIFFGYSGQSAVGYHLGRAKAIHENSSPTKNANHPISSNFSCTQDCSTYVPFNIPMINWDANHQMPTISIHPHRTKKVKGRTLNTANALYNKRKVTGKQLTQNYLARCSSCFMLSISA